jgi:hypothetical protein
MDPPLGLTSQPRRPAVNAFAASTAKLLLAEQQPPIGEVALAVGFGSQSHFRTIFRRTRGVTPGQYRSPCIRVTRSTQRRCVSVRFGVSGSCPK